MSNVMPFFPKQCGHTEGVLTVAVGARCLKPKVVSGAKMVLLKCPCAFRLHGLAQNWPGIFPINFHTNSSCEMSMCVSTAQARTKRCLRDWGPAFFL